jgi:hypothetical protein
MLYARLLSSIYPKNNITFKIIIKFRTDCLRPRNIKFKVHVLIIVFMNVTRVSFGLVFTCIVSKVKLKGKVKFC